MPLSELLFGEGIASNSSNIVPIKSVTFRSLPPGLCCSHWAHGLLIMARHALKASAFHTIWTQRNCISYPANDGTPFPMSPTPLTDATPAMLAVSRAASKPCTLPCCHCHLDPSLPARAARRPGDLTLHLGSITGLFSKFLFTV